MFNWVALFCIFFNVLHLFIEVELEYEVSWWDPSTVHRAG
jgi:hypothetical protein